jgi:hypothetical protein
MRTANIERTLAILAWLWVTVALVFLTDVSCSFGVGVGLLVFWVVLALQWLIMGLAGLPDLRSKRFWWIAAGVAGCFGLVLTFTDVGLVVRTALSRPWLDAYAQKVAVDTRDQLHEPRWVGLFRVDGTENRDGAVFLYTSYGFFNRYGLAYIPPSMQSRKFNRIRTHPMLGRWYTFEWKF